MRRHLVLVPIVLLLSLTACGDPNGGGAPPTGAPVFTPGPDTTYALPTAGSVTEPPAPSVATPATPSGSGDPAWGTQYAFLTSGDPSTPQITYDLIEWYDGAEAVKACAEDGEKAAENDYCVGYYIRNNNTRLRTLTVYPDAPVSRSVPQPKAVDLETFLAQVGDGSVIRFEVDANRIVKLEHVYRP